MKNDYMKNAEGYMDLTAYAAIMKADRDLEKRDRKKANKKGHKRSQKTKYKEFKKGNK